ncbi:MAG: LSm family protein [Aigarchaeota archaeon]|nr:LSm family protein [Aigarchaeota archaeon]MCS7127143.1 LSm family protein [Candidatus Calditenuaceae archaeon]MDW8043266.1 LSm family protein [Nitrososphaerota archaeon]
MSADITLKLLNRSLGNQVLIKLRSGRMIRGVLVGFDQHMNVVLNPAEEVHQDGSANRLGTVILRGDNIVMISPGQLREDEGR